MDKSSAISGLLNQVETLKKHHREKFGTNSGFEAFFEQCKGLERSQLLFRTCSTTRNRNLQFRPTVSTGFLEFSPVDFFLFVKLRKSRENSKDSWWRNLRKIFSRLWLAWCFGPNLSGRYSELHRCKGPPLSSRPKMILSAAMIRRRL